MTCHKDAFGARSMGQACLAAARVAGITAISWPALAAGMPTTAMVSGTPKIDCSMPEADMAGVAGVARVDTGSSRLYAGTHQASSQNQNPVVASFGTHTWCHDDYETGTPDGRGTGLLHDPDRGLAVVLSVDGGGSGLETLTNGGWQRSYGQGGGPRVSVVLRIDPATGTVLEGSEGRQGSFLVSKLSDGRTNSLSVTDLFFNTAGELVVNADAWYSPLHPDGSRITVSGSSPFAYTVVLAADLSVALRSGVDSREQTRDADRVMNWAEALLPDLLPAAQRTEWRQPPFEIRQYSSADSYLGHDTRDGMLYGYLAAQPDAGLIPLGRVAEHLAGAAAAGF